MATFEPAELRCEDFGEWLDYCILGAEEIGIQMGYTKGSDLYNRPLTMRQAVIRLMCKRVLAKHPELWR